MIDTSNHTKYPIHPKLPIQFDCTSKLRSRLQKLFTAKILKKNGSLNTLIEHPIESSNNYTIQPIGITNSSQNCWCIAALQILCNTPIGLEMTNSTKFPQDFPEITKFIELYHKISSSPKLLGKRIQYIRKELYEKVSHNFSKKQSEPADAKEFLNLLLNKYAFGQEFQLSRHSMHLTTLLFAAKGKYLFIETTPSSSELNLHELFNPTPYKLLGFICYITSDQHYIAIVKISGEWYKCDDKMITKFNRTDLALRKNIVLIIASQKHPSPS